ncbi:MAG: glycoside hydrolase [Bacteroides sp. SM23_62_1]|nr:MAG: glycoside hydrolase [Bacteroides sp. SM23_62_1]
MILTGIILGTLVFTIFSCSSPDASYSDPADLWPEPAVTMKPWTRWWWHGSAVDKQNITNRLEEFAETGIGGVEITPIFGVKGYEDRFIRYLSPGWMAMLIHTLDEAERLGLGVDMVQGTGWPFGGPQVDKEYAAGRIFIQTYRVKAGNTFHRNITIDDPDQKNLACLQFVFAFDEQGNKTDLTSELEDGSLYWTPESDQLIFAIFKGNTNQQVKRAAPGGEGFVMDHFSEEALADYLEPYEQALGPVKNRLRALFNDSYEVYDADYTTHFFKEFQARRGYDFTDHFPLLVSGSVSEDALRILADYRETLSDLVLEAMSENWVSWANDHSFLTKYQAHGCPGNLLDIYATADIPECETFYATAFDIPGLRREESDARQAYTDLIMLKFASSAAHISGKDLTSSETLTWLREHFKTALSQCKPEVEQILLSGVNHVFFHGSTYYPDEAEWPGWKFYASVNFVPTYTIWKDAHYMFDYITRCQSLLQSGKSDNEILVYWPFHDVIGEDLKGQLLLQLGIDNKDEWLVTQPFYNLTMTLIEQGYSVDFVSDRFLEKTVVDEGLIKTPGMSYKALVIPDCRHMPLSTMETLLRLAGSGGIVVFGGLPETVPGYHRHEERSHRLLEMISKAGDDLVLSENIPVTLRQMGIRGESLKEMGLDFIRREMMDGKVYYIVNHSSGGIDGFVAVGTRAKSVVIMDPLTGKAGQARIKRSKDGTEVYLRIKPGEAFILRTFNMNITLHDWEYFEDSGAPVALKGTWQIEFLDGGPAIPEGAAMTELKSWTGLGDEAEAFSGTARYTIKFGNPDTGVTNWQLDLGDVRESARIWVNGEDKGCLWSVPFKAEIGALKNGENTLEMEVTNLSANRLRDLEMRGIEWKIFYEINMVNRHYEEFDATAWDPMPSGIMGPVSLTPLRRKSF